MSKHATRALAFLAGALLAPAPSLLAQSATPPATGAATLPDRAIRRTIPMTDMIRRAWAAGTRDATGRPGPSYWQLRTDYTIHARLDPTTGRVSGRESVAIHNTSDAEMSSIHLRLDQNIFAANVPKLESVPEITDGMPVTHLAVDGRDVDLNPPPRRRFRRPGAGTQEVTLAAYGLGQTTAWITLPTPIPPGGTGTLEAEWSFKVPRSDGVRGLRMGSWADSLFQVAQWYPRVAVFDDLREGGWDTDPYLGPSEFYNNFGSFDVTIDVPSGWIVAATGVLQNPEAVLTPTARERLSQALEADTTRTVVGPSERGPGRATAAGDRLAWHFAADSVADFAWATSDRFVWDVSRATIPGKGPIPIQILYESGNAERYAQAGPVVRHALEFYSKLWMPYAFPQMTIVDGPEGGMEYPSFIMSGVGAADHETGHQWWPMMVGVNETWYGFMDEGFNQYMNILSRDDRTGAAVDLDGLGQRYGSIAGNEREAPLMWDANYGGPLYSFQAYSKAPLMLSMLGGIVGDTAVWKAMSGYAQAWRFKHPSPWDYAFFMNEALGQDLSWFWNAWLFETSSVDGGIRNVVTDGARTTVTVEQDGDMPSPVVLEVALSPGSSPIVPMQNATMVDDTTAVVTWPVDVWFSGNRTFDAVLDFGGRSVRKVTLDPHCRFPDRDITDNIWPPDPSLADATSGSPFGPATCYGR